MNIYRNKKNGKNYIVLYHDVVNATNNAGVNEIMTVYVSCETGALFVRDSFEFAEKFSLVSEEEKIYTIPTFSSNNRPQDGFSLSDDTVAIKISPQPVKRHPIQEMHLDKPYYTKTDSEYKPLPKFVKVVDTQGKDNIKTDREHEPTCLRLMGTVYFRDGGSWGVPFCIKDDGRIYIDSTVESLNDLELVECTEEEWKKSNKGYIPDKY